MLWISEADLGMFSMFGRTGAPAKRGPHKRAIIFFETCKNHLSKTHIKFTQQAWRAKML